ncbi:MAG TPA: FAD-binding oxidoreductase [Mycobacteriales bacterium]
MSDRSARLRPAPGSDGYPAIAERLAAEVAAVPAGAPIRLAKKTSNLFRDRHPGPRHRLDVSGLDRVFAVDTRARTAEVGGMTTYEHLVAATLPYGLSPLVVPQLRTITLGGAVSGLGIESASFRNGMPHESVLAADVLTGDGRIVTATPDGEHGDLFRGLPNSYGTLGYALKLTIELEPVRPYVHLRHRRFRDAGEYAAALADVCASREHAGEPVDFVDGTVFGRDELVLTLGTYADTAPYVSDYTGQQIYYRSLLGRTEDHLTTHDYLWRWDTDWFWCSRAFGVQNPRIRRLVPRRLLRSETYWKIAAFERRYGLYGRLERLRGAPAKEQVVQDVDVPIERVPEFLDFFHRELGISPLWICPVRQRDPAVDWSLYSLDPERLYVNFGFWSTVDLEPGEDTSTHNRLVEEEVDRLGGFKSLYSTAFYSPEDFDRLYSGADFASLKKRYDPHSRFPDLYAKCVQRA